MRMEYKVYNVSPGPEGAVAPQPFFGVDVMTFLYLCLFFYLCRNLPLLAQINPSWEYLLLHQRRLYIIQCVYFFFFICSEVQLIVLANIATMSAERPVSLDCPVSHTSPTC